MVSVVIPVYNEEKFIARCLLSLSHQTVIEPFEVIIVNNGSTDATVDVAKRFQKSLDLRIINESRKGRGQARATGFAAARSDIIFSTDADIEVPPDWIERFLIPLRNGKASAVTSKVIISDCSEWLRLLVTSIFWISTTLFHALYGFVWLGGFNFAITKKAYERAGGFNRNLNVQEDVELSFRVARNHKILFLTIPKVKFSARRFKNNLVQAVFVYLISFIQVIFLHKSIATLSDTS